MRIDTVLPLALSTLLMMAALGGPVFAAGQDEDREASALQNAKVTLVQAIGIAEQQTGGQAFDAGVSTTGGQTRIAVETNGPRGVQTVTVDAHTGQVVGTHAGGEPD